MQVFELYFNPKFQEDRFFESFVFEAENVTEKRLGNLYLAGEIRNGLPQNATLLGNLALAMKKKILYFFAENSRKSDCRSAETGK